MNVLHTRRQDDGSAERRELDDLLRESDVVSLHVPLNAETHGLLDARRLGLLRDGACLVNTARGAIVDEDALVAELSSGRLRAGLDVFVHEPNVPEALLGLPNVVLSPPRRERDARDPRGRDGGARREHPRRARAAIAAEPGSRLGYRVVTAP